MYIDGEWITADRVMEVRNPATGEVVDTVPMAGTEETKRAVQAAKRAFPGWSELTADQRGAYLRQLAGKLTEKKEELAEIITKEMGKTIHDARFEVGSAIGFFQWYAEEARRVYGDVIPASAPNKRVQVIRQPVGVVAAITPWNFPLAMAARKLAPALAVGCTVVLKPSKEAPLSSAALCRIFEEIDLPKGVVNLVTGESRVIGDVLMNERAVSKISFTGSTGIGKKLIAQSASTIKRVSMELGGHAPFIVFEDADIELAVEGLVKGKFSSTGQQCVCPNRIYVHENIAGEFAEALRRKTEEIKVGNGLDEETGMGALINGEAVERMDRQVEDAVTQGAVLVCGGRRLTEGEHEKGFFYPPTILSGVTEEMLITREETFGPVIPLLTFSTAEEVLERANDTEYGLAAYFYTRDLSLVYRMSERLEYGMVGVNDVSPFSVQAPFGGVKESGLGREGGKYGLDDYLETKLISVTI
ncbi:NAD-dependent succinate-semialdehyde dehydrogenase [Sporosarcina sp. P1]|uniref:NAD-dependent succinate-semialdehyde dehydrogenase n=1 Tax=Sporosarcina sp. P1 TaxID=2048257 RepID=UPI000C168B4D|nr:NAD-dependent succinate-semialdehyde dehydrogenase [Sporosarcina sp. P1]PIC82991.1 succinate-semialdehyde dehydrogenase (NADP(+)) [Sporosarcina sp. P1]